MHTEYRPDEAGVAFAVKPAKGSFIGVSALAPGDGEPGRRLSCLRFDDPAAIVLGKEPVLQGDEIVGYVTSAGFGYSVGESLVYAYLPAMMAAVDTPLAVEYFGHRLTAKVVSEPRWDPKGARLRG
jgi:glycine cleavage system aminomethyltransferase T